MIRLDEGSYPYMEVGTMLKLEKLFAGYSEEQVLIWTPDKFDITGALKNDLEVVLEMYNEWRVSRSVVERPAHYTRGKIEVYDFIQDQGLDFAKGNVVKYICRAGIKGDELEDLKKARWYIDAAIKGVSE